MTNTRQPVDLLRALSSAHSSLARSETIIERAGTNVEDEYLDVDPACDQAILSLDFDTPPGPGYCAVPFLPSTRHSSHGRDVRWESAFTSFILVRSSKDRAGGVYTDQDDMKFALQGLHPQPEVARMTNFLDCLELWKADCRRGVHGHAGPPTPKISNSPPKDCMRTFWPTLHRPGWGALFGRALSCTGYAIQSAARGALSMASALPSSPNTTSGLLSTTPTLALASLTPASLPRVALTPPSSPASGCLGPEMPRSTSTFIQPVWFSRDSQGLGLVLTRNCTYARDLHATHGNIDVVTDSDKLNKATDIASPRSALYHVRLRQMIHSPRCNEGIKKPRSARETTVADVGIYDLMRKKPSSASPRQEAVDSRLFQWTCICMRGVLYSHPPLFRHSNCTTSAMGKRVKAKDDPSRQAPGPTHWVIGVKRAFLKRHEDEFIRATNRGVFYDRITTKFIIKFGAGFDLSTDLEEDLPDPDDDDLIEDYSHLSPEEVTQAKAYRKRLRKKIGQYYRGEQSKIKTSKDEDGINQLFADHSQAQVPRQTLPTHIVQYYSKLYYHTRVKHVFEASFAAATETADADLAKWDEMGVDPPPGWKRPHNLSHRNQVTAECWARETQSFQDSVVRAHLEEQDRQKAAFASAMHAPKVLTLPEDFQHLCASLFLFGPMPDDGGKLGVLSAHAGLTRGVNPQTLAHFDPTGLSEIESVLIDFAKNCYNNPECISRALPGTRTRRGIAGPTPELTTSSSTSPIRESSPPRQPLTRLRRAGELAVAPASDLTPCAPVPSVALQPQVIAPAAPAQKTFTNPASLFDDDTEMSEVNSSMDVAPFAPVSTSTGTAVRLNTTPESMASARDAAPVDTTLLGTTPEPMAGARDAAHPDATPESMVGVEDAAPVDTTLPGATPVSMAGARDAAHPDAAPVGVEDAAPVDMTLAGATLSGLMPDPMAGVRDVTPPGGAFDATAVVTDAALLDLQTDKPSVTMTTTEKIAGQSQSSVAPNNALHTPLDALLGTITTTNTLPDATLEPPPGDDAAPRLVAVDLVDVAKGREEDVWKCKMPAGCPPHIAGIFAACSRGQEWGLEFARAVTVYLALERSLGFPILNHGRLVLAGSIRPSIYRDWVVERRDFDRVVDIGEPRAFGAKWWTWWEAMQPPLRVSPAGDLLAVDAVAAEVSHLAEWGHLKKCCGRDGLVQFLLTLVWWGDMVNDPDRRVAHAAQRLEWELAIRDFREVLEALMLAPDFKRIAAKRAAGIDYTINMSSKHGLVVSEQGTPSAKRARTALSDPEAAAAPAPSKAPRRAKNNKSSRQPSNENKAPRSHNPRAAAVAVSATRQSSRKRYVSLGNRGSGSSGGGGGGGGGEGGGGGGEGGGGGGGEGGGGGGGEGGGEVAALGSISDERSNAYDGASNPHAARTISINVKSVWITCE
ncbi:hypothetical protein GGG16DRAFT_103236 [Schizophyllum commune]